ncbi:TetR-like C-terminal domain-containing protein [Nonomuraea sp. NPDC049655]|uniref:TetR-like C-terminal domain-containing protein n=1 Tax=Nonomuraea sp. NPDC049655 TaxID=3364355 RepID=UPI00378C6247
MELDDATAEADAARRHSEIKRVIPRAVRRRSRPSDATRSLHSTFHGYVSLETAGGFSRTEREVDAPWSRCPATGPHPDRV